MAQQAKVDTSSRNLSIGGPIINRNSSFVDQIHTPAISPPQAASPELNLQSSPDHPPKHTKRDSEGRHIRCERCIKNKKKCDGNRPKCGTCSIKTTCVWPEANFTRQELLRHNKRAKKDRETMSEDDNAAMAAAKDDVIMSGTEDATKVDSAPDVVDAPCDIDAHPEPADLRASTEPDPQAATKEVLVNGVRYTIPILPRIDISQNAPGDYQPLVDFMVNLDLEDTNLVTGNPGVNNIPYLQYLCGDDPHPMGQLYESEDDNNNVIYKVTLLLKEFSIEPEDIPMYLAFKTQYNDLKTDILTAQIAAINEAGRAQREDPEVARKAQEYYAELLRRAPGGPDYAGPASASATPAAGSKASSPSRDRKGKGKGKEKEEEEEEKGEKKESEGGGQAGWKQKTLQEVLEGNEEEWLREIEEASRRGIMLPY